MLTLLLEHMKRREKGTHDPVTFGDVLEIIQSAAGDHTAAGSSAGAGASEQTQTGVTTV